MLHPSFSPHDCLIFFKVGSRYGVVGSRYGPLFAEKVYQVIQNLKIRIKVPLILIFSKTVRSVFVINYLNNFLRVRQTENRKKNSEVRRIGKGVSIPTTDYRLPTTDFENLRSELCKSRQV